MRRFLYISPFFPPMSRVGALRPLKFARHLPAYGWAPVVLCDLQPGDTTESRLLGAIPKETVVIRRYGRGAADEPLYARPTSPAPTKPAQRSRLLPALKLPRAEDLNPLGRHGFGIGHALRSARSALRAHPCEAIMVNADPYAAMIVGARLARETGLPLIQDLRDPWSCCDLRRPLRPRPQQALVDRLERWSIETASAVILNTETARHDYLAHYSDLSPETFHAIRNHTDASLFDAPNEPARPEFERFSLVFLGNFRRFVEGDTLLRALARVRADGLGPDRLRLVITGSLPEVMWERARALKVAEMLDDHPFIPYLEVASFMERADMLLSFSHPTAQRIPAKIYDYLASVRPLLVVADNPELRELLKRAGGATTHGLDDAEGIAAAIVATYAAGRRQTIARPDVGVRSERAAKDLAAIFDRVT